MWQLPLGLRQLECGMAGGASLRVGRSGAEEGEVEKGRKRGKYARNVHVYPELHSASGGPPQLGRYKGGPCCCLQLRTTLTSLREKWRGLSRPSSSLQKLRFTFCWKGEALSKRDRLDRKQDRDSYLGEDYSSREPDEDFGSTWGKDFVIYCFETELRQDDRENVFRNEPDFCTLLHFLWLGKFNYHNISWTQSLEWFYSINEQPRINHASAYMF